jgi:hypothetical protein
VKRKAVRLTSTVHHYSLATSTPVPTIVIAGLDPAIHCRDWAGQARA